MGLLREPPQAQASNLQYNPQPGTPKIKATRIQNLSPDAQYRDKHRKIEGIDHSAATW